MTIVDRLRAAGCVFAEEEARLLAAQAGSATELDAMAERRAAGEPLEHVLGWARFCGLRIAVAPGVFVPRRRTEFLAEQAIASAMAVRPVRIIVELCCGAAAVSAALLASAATQGAEGTELHATDIDPAAVDVARRNLDPARATVYQGDLYQPLPTRLRGSTDVIVANAPYVPTGELGLMPAEARHHEPRQALDGGPDGLDIVRRIAAEAPHWLRPTGHLLVETSERQAPRVAEAFTASGLTAHTIHGEDATVIRGTAR